MTHSDETIILIYLLFIINNYYNDNQNDNIKL